MFQSVPQKVCIISLVSSIKVYNLLCEVDPRGSPSTGVRERFLEQWAACQWRNPSEFLDQSGLSGFLFGDTISPSTYDPEINHQILPRGWTHKPPDLKLSACKLNNIYYKYKAPT